MYHFPPVILTGKGFTNDSLTSNSLPTVGEPLVIWQKKAKAKYYWLVFSTQTPPSSFPGSCFELALKVSMKECGGTSSTDYSWFTHNFKILAFKICFQIVIQLDFPFWHVEWSKFNRIKTVPPLSCRVSRTQPCHKKQTADHFPEQLLWHRSSVRHPHHICPDTRLPGNPGQSSFLQLNRRKTIEN